MPPSQICKLKSQPTVPENETLLGNRIIRDEMIKMRSYWSMADSLSSTADVLTNRNLDAEVDAYGRKMMRRSKSR